MKRILYMISLLCLGLLSTGCDSEEQPGEEEKRTVEVPVEFNCTSSGNELTTRTNPVGPGNPGETNTRPIYVDRVKVYIYQRPADQTYETDREGFLRANELVLPAHRTGNAGADGQPRFTATGKIPLESEYEYRMTAVAYSEEQGEKRLFELNDSYFNHAEITLLDKDEYKTPELFFGNVVYQDTDTVFRYDSKNPKKLTGWLYRGVAGIELNLENVAPEVKRIDLLADSINTRVKARLYDDFRSAYDMKRNGRFEHFVIGSWERNIADVKNNNIQIIGSNLLAVCTSLSLRITIDKDGKEEQVVCRLQVREKKEDGDVDTDENGGTGGSANAQLRSIPGDAGNGTGIIPGGEETPVDPENPDSGKNPFQICFKRNQYYKILGDYEKLTTMEYVLQVTVNPNWDGDVYLPLDKSDDSN